MNPRAPAVAAFPEREGRGRSRSSERGSVSAEFAVALPIVVLTLALCVSALQVSTRQGRAQDAAAVAARLAARGEPAAVSGAVARLLPEATVSLDRGVDTLCAVVAAGGPPGPFAGVRVAATSCAPVAG